MRDLQPDERRHLMSRLGDLIGALDLVLGVYDDDELARFRGTCVRLYLDLMDVALLPFDYEKTEEAG